MLLAAYLHRLNPFAWEFADGVGIRWYGLSYVAGFVLAWWIIRSLARRGRSPLAPEQAGDLIVAVAIGTVTDPYQPVERRLRLTRRCLEVFAEFRNPAVIVTKGSLIVRDADLLAEMAQDRTAIAHVSITSLDDSLRRVLEPRAASPSKRLAAVEALAKAGVPVGVMVAPVIPGLTDSEIPRLVQAAADAGALSVGHIVLRLPHGVVDLFSDWLERHFPERKSKVLGRIREMRGGRLNDPRFGSRMRGEGFFADQTQSLFELACRRAGFADERAPLETSAFRRPGGDQMELF